MTFRGVRAVLFDLDGTLVESAPDLAQAVNRLLAERGRGAVAEARVRRWIGNGARRLVARALTGEDDGEVEAGELDAAMQRFFSHYADCLTDRTAVYPGTVEALEALQAAGLALGVVTNKPGRFTDPLLAALGLDRFFGVAVSGDTLAVKKPDAGPLAHAAEALGVPLASALMVGDSMADVMAARNAGVPIVCVPYGYRRGDDIFEANPDAVVDRLDELPPLLA